MKTASIPRRVLSSHKPQVSLELLLITSIDVRPIKAIHATVRAAISAAVSRGFPR